MYVLEIVKDIINFYKLSLRNFQENLKISQMNSNIKYPELPQINNKEPQTLNCQLCYAGFYKNQSTPLSANCGHYFCLEKCYQRILNLKKCPLCNQKVQSSSFKKTSSKQIRYNPAGGNTFTLSIISPKILITYKRNNVDGKIKLGDFLNSFPPIQSELEACGNNLNNVALVIGSKTQLYGIVYNKSFDELAAIFDLVASNIKKNAQNPIMINYRFQGGKCNNI